MKAIILPIVIDVFGTVTKRITKGTGGLEGWRTSGDYPKYYIIENGQNTEKSLGDLSRLAVTQTPVKFTSANADVKTSNEKIMIIIIISLMVTTLMTCIWVPMYLMF